MRWVPSGSEILLGDEKVKRVIHWVLIRNKVVLKLFFFAFQVTKPHYSEEVRTIHALSCTNRDDEWWLQSVNRILC